MATTKANLGVKKKEICFGFLCLTHLVVFRTVVEMTPNWDPDG